MRNMEAEYTAKGFSVAFVTDKDHMAPEKIKGIGASWNLAITLMQSTEVKYEINYEIQPC